MNEKLQIFHCKKAITMVGVVCYMVSLAKTIFAQICNMKLNGTEP